MSCLLCASSNKAEFGSEILIHFSGLKNLGKTPVWVFPKLSVCLDCGFSLFTTPKSELALLAIGLEANEAVTRKAWHSDAALRLERDGTL
jgi:hypothetical protein